MKYETIWRPDPYVYPGLSHSTKPADATKILHVVEKFYQLEPGAIDTKIRKRPYPEARYVAAFLLMHYCHITSLKVGAMLKLDHATVLYGCKYTLGQIQWCKKFRGDFLDICYRLEIDGYVVNELVKGKLTITVKNFAKTR